MAALMKDFLTNVEKEKVILHRMQPADDSDVRGAAIGAILGTART